MPLHPTASRDARLAAGLTQAELARRLGVAPARISDIEAGRNPDPRVQLVERVAAALDVSIEAITVEPEPRP